MWGTAGALAPAHLAAPRFSGHGRVAVLSASGALVSGAAAGPTAGAHQEGYGATSARKIPRRAAVRSVTHTYTKTHTRTHLRPLPCPGSLAQQQRRPLGGRPPGIRCGRRIPRPRHLPVGTGSDAHAARGGRSLGAGGAGILPQVPQDSGFPGFPAVDAAALMPRWHARSIGVWLHAVGLWQHVTLAVVRAGASSMLGHV